MWNPVVESGGSDLRGSPVTGRPLTLVLLLAWLLPACLETLQVPVVQVRFHSIIR